MTNPTNPESEGVKMSDTNLAGNEGADLSGGSLEIVKTDTVAEACRLCGVKARRWLMGVVYTTIAPHLGLCGDCINRIICR